jgi:phosphocarrier protein
MNRNFDSMSASAEATVLITHEVGLHARPSVKFTKLAKTFAAEVEVALAANGPWFDAKSIVKVMAAKAPKARCCISGQGRRCRRGGRRAGRTCARDFDEGADHARTA